MIRSRLFRKVAVALTVVILLSAATVLLLVTPHVEQEALAQIQQSLTCRAALLREIAGPALERGEDATLQARVSRLGEETATRYTVIRADGVVLADSEQDPTTVERHDLRPEVRAARETNGPGMARRFSRTVQKEMLHLALPVRSGETLTGYVRASLPTTWVDERRAAIRARVALGAGVAAAIGLVLGLALTHRVTGRLRRMVEGARAIAEGQEPRQLPVRAQDETGELARALDQLGTVLRQRLEALARERNDLTAVLGSMREGVVAIDLGERVVHMNAVAGEMLRTSPAESIGRRIWEVTRVQEVSDVLDAVLRDNTEHGREIRLPGQPRPRAIELHASPLRDSGQGPAGALVVLHDVTELRRLEAVRREFVANVSHELKTPLTAIRGMIETLLDDASMDEADRTRFLERTRDQALRLSSLVTDLLVLSRIESEENALEHRPLDLRDPVRDSANRVDPTPSGRPLRFEVILPGELVPVLGDEEAMRQIVDNLLDNALKYTPDGGSVAVRLSRTGEDAIVEVQDTGIGIEPEHLDRIFERFYRVDKARSRELGGTGLGLSIVKHLVEALDGYVDVESEPGRGSTFRVSFPIHEAPPE